MTHYWPSLLAMLFCIVMSAFFSASETAFSSLSRTRLQVLAEAGNRKALLTLKLSENYDKLLSTILIGNNIVNIAVASIGTLVFVQLYGDIGATLSTVVVTIVVLIFGEVTPKSIAKDFPEKFAMFSAPQPACPAPDARQFPVCAVETAGVPAVQRQGRGEDVPGRAAAFAARGRAGGRH